MLKLVVHKFTLSKSKLFSPGHLKIFPVVYGLIGTDRPNTIIAQMPYVLGCLIQRLIFWFAQQIYKQPVSPRYAGGQLPEERQRGIYEPAFAIIADDQRAVIGRFAGVVHLQHRAIFSIGVAYKI